MTIGEADILMLQRRQKDFAFAKPILPNADAFATALDKGATFRIAETVGIRTPMSVSGETLGSIVAATEGMRFPVVLKWPNPHRISTRLREAGHSLEKYRYIYSRQELERHLHSLRDLGEYPLVQEYCSGVGLGQMIFMHGGQAIQKFQHLRIAEWPPEGGVSAVCESLPPDRHQSNMTKSVELLRRLNWQGAAMVEYRYDPSSGELCLMEINGRFWGSLPLAFHAGAQFAWMTYQVGTGREPDRTPDYAVGITCRYIIPELKRLARIVISPRQIQNRSLKLSRTKEITKFVARYLNLSTRYYVYTNDDPAPFFSDVWGAFSEKVLRRR